MIAQQTSRACGFARVQAAAFGKYNFDWIAKQAVAPALLSDRKMRQLTSFREQ
jgi:hypothetical protein